MKVERTNKQLPKPTLLPISDNLFSAEKDCMELRKAMKGLGTNERKIINIIGTRTNQQRQLIKKTYPKVCPDRDLLKDFRSELSGNIRNLVVNFLY